MQPILMAEAFSALSQHYNEYLAEPHAYFYAGIPPSTRSVPWEDSLLDKYVERTSWTSPQLFKPV
jgi:hypothetical protein